MKRPTTIFFAIMVQTMLCAGNITLTNIHLNGQNTGYDYTMVQFDLCWENSWRTSSAPYNWDSAWVFVKYRINGNYVSAAGASSSGTTVTVASTTGLRVGMPVKVTAGNGSFFLGTIVTAITDATTFTVSHTLWEDLSGGAVVTGYAIWEHATINTGGHTAPAGSTITPASDGTGVFIYRDDNGAGTNTFTNAKIRWNYGTNGVADNAVTDVKVYAIEMVYVPAGTFVSGSGGYENGAFYSYPATTNTYSVSTEDAVTVGTATGNLYYGNPWGTSGDQTGPVPAGFPKGYNGFYCMKYEISQQGYVDFLNTLTYPQQTTRTAITPGSAPGTYLYTTYPDPCRNKIYINSSGVDDSTSAIYATDYPYVACNYISWPDVAAYLGWSGLRPMTELEYEKACRGTVSAVANEYAWGSTSYTAATGITNNGGSNETASNSGANSCMGNSGTGGALRVGVFAQASTTREEAGATYYGIMEMSGNMYERAVTVGNIAGRSFTGLHGNGALNGFGDATVDYWPGINGNSTGGTANTTYGGTTGVTEAAGAGFRDGSWADGAMYSRISERSSAAGDGNNSRWFTFGGRGVRSAP